MGARIDLGSDHWMTWFVPYADGDERIGVIVWHPARPDDIRCAEIHDGRCGGAVFFAGHEPAGRPSWQVQQLDPLTITPSLLCHCGDHGFITGGLWVVA